VLKNEKSINQLFIKISGEKIKPVEIHSHFVDIRGNGSTKYQWWWWLEIEREVMNRITNL
jgi:hypothetical protein